MIPPPGTNPPYDVPMGTVGAAPVYPNQSTRYNRSGLQFLRDQVATYFEGENIPAVVAKVGLKYRSFQTNVNTPDGANRVVFIPGEFDGSPTSKGRKYGSLSRKTRNASSVNNPRELAEWDRPCTISIWASPDPSDFSDEELALQRVEDLLEQVIRGLYSSAEISPENPEMSFSIAGAFSLGEVIVNAPPTESGYGAEFLVQLILRGPFYDKPLDVVFPSLKVTHPTFVGG